MHKSHEGLRLVTGVICSVMLSCSTVSPTRLTPSPAEQTESGNRVLVQVATADGPVIGGAQVSLVSSTALSY